MISCEPRTQSSLDALLPTVLLELLDADHFESPLARERKAVVPPRHVAVGVVGLDELADDAGFGEAGEAAQVCARQARVSDPFYLVG